MARLAIIHHSPSPLLHELCTSVIDGTTADGIHGVEVHTVPALVASPIEALEADAILLGTPANIGYMSGALKHFLDQAYYPCMGATDGLPFGLWVHGNNDTTGARRSVEAVAKGLNWTAAAEPVEVVGTCTADDRDQLWNLGATLALAAAEAAAGAG